jgi:FtsZ-binding cell division protein ZapB
MSLEILDQLEERIRDAAAKLESLRERNGELETRLAELEGELAAAGDGGAAAWRAERAELERRVAALVDRLEGLLAG